MFWSGGGSSHSVATLRVHPAVTRLTVYRRPYGLWLAETVLLVRPSNTPPRRGLEAKQMWTGFSGILVMFPLLALDPDDRLRYPPVSLLMDMCWWFWLGRCVPENLFDVRFWGFKLGWWWPILQTHEFSLTVACQLRILVGYQRIAGVVFRAVARDLPAEIRSAYVDQKYTRHSNTINCNENQQNAPTCKFTHVAQTPWKQIQIKQNDRLRGSENNNLF